MSLEKKRETELLMNMTELAVRQLNPRSLEQTKVAGQLSYNFYTIRLRYISLMQNSLLLDEGEVVIEREQYEEIYREVNQINQDVLNLLPQMPQGSFRILSGNLDRYIGKFLYTDGNQVFQIGKSGKSQLTILHNTLIYLVRGPNNYLICNCPNYSFILAKEDFPPDGIGVQKIKDETDSIDPANAPSVSS